MSDPAHPPEKGKGIGPWGWLIIVIIVIYSGLPQAVIQTLRGLFQTIDMYQRIILLIVAVVAIFMAINNSKK